MPHGVLIKENMMRRGVKSESWNLQSALPCHPLQCQFPRGMAGREKACFWGGRGSLFFNGSGWGGAG